MSDGGDTAQALQSILSVLKSIEKKLDVHEKRLNTVQGVPGPLAHGTAIEDPTSTGIKEDTAGEDSQTLGTSSSSLGSPGSPGSPVDSDDASEPPITKISYIGNDSHAQELANNLSLRKTLEAHLGDCWELPDDRRLPLNFFNRPKDWTNNTWAPHYNYPFNLTKVTRNALDHLVGFDKELRSLPGNDFLIIDYDAAHNSRLYRIGEPAIGYDLKVDPRYPSHQQWSRLILYQGMTTGSSINPHKARDATLEPIPYFSSFSAPRGLWSHIFSHMNLKRRQSTTNPYIDPIAGFTTHFYEIRKENTFNANELWDHGQLYDHPLGWSFRKSAFTLYSPCSAPAESLKDGMSRHWTLLLLCPDAFFNENTFSFPLHDSTPSKADTSRQHFGALHRLGAEINLIAQGLNRISERWAEFQTFFDYILDNGRSLFNPSEHDSFLFDNSSFDRSRRYFWAIDCLGEFEQATADNIHQWEMYREARIDPFFLPSSPTNNQLPSLDAQQLHAIEKQLRILRTQRAYFLNKLAATRALRDALFSASAVIESRASTRLGENLKLLTFVNIFFLPLSFCTSLWSISTPYSTTGFALTITCVALATYFAMFNIESLSGVMRGVYERHKRGVVGKMKRDGREGWREMGRRFEVFRPRGMMMGGEREGGGGGEPSEWWVAVYRVVSVGRGSTWRWWRRKKNVEGAKGKKGEGKMSEGAFREDEGWVL